MPKVTGSDRTDIATNNGVNGYYSVAKPFGPSDIGKVLVITDGTGWFKCSLLISNVLGPNPAYNASSYAAVLDDNNFLGKQGTEETNLATGFVMDPTVFIKFVGNSITDGNTGLTGATLTDKYAASYMSQAMNHPSFSKEEVFWRSYGSGGGQTSNIMAFSTSTETPPFPSATKNVLAFMEWVNQMSFGDPGTKLPSEQYAFAQSFATARRSDGWDVLYTSPTAYNGEDLVTVTQAMRDELATGFTNGDFDGFVDLGAVPESQDSGNATYFGDAIHPTNALHAIMGVAEQPELLRLTGLSGSVTSVTIDQGDVTRYGGTVTDFTATLVGDPSDTDITWTIQSGPGSINASTGAYTAAGGLASGSQTAVIRAASHQDPTKYDEATVTIPIHQAGGGGSVHVTVGSQIIP